MVSKSRNSKRNRDPNTIEGDAVPDGVESFWIEVAWNMQDAVSDENDPNWNPKRKRLRELEDNVVWWPAFVSICSFEKNQYKLCYTTAHSSTSTKDIDIESEHDGTFLLNGWLKHTKGDEKGKLCIWRYARWEQDNKSEHQLRSASNARKEDVDELRGCILELQSDLRKEKESNSLISERIIALERNFLVLKKESPCARVRRYLINSLLVGAEFRGKDSRFRTESKSYSSVHRQSIIRPRSVDCTLFEYRELAKECEVSLRDRVTFTPSQFRVCGFNIRQKDVLSINCQTFHEMCSALHLTNNTSSNMLFQTKTDNEGCVVAYQIGEMHQKDKLPTNNSTDEPVPECVILPGGSFSRVQGQLDSSFMTISREDGTWHEQSGTCDKRFKFASLTGADVYRIMAIEKQEGDSSRHFSYRIEWESLRSDTTVIGTSIGEDAMLGKATITIPLIHLRTKRIVDEVNDIIYKQKSMWLGT